jgi:hypothetical protein
MIASTRRYLAFDIEIAKKLPGDFSLWREHRPIGITCAATCIDGYEPLPWYSLTDGKFDKQMSRGELGELVGFLVRAVRDGYTILTWNGASFDFDVLAEESGLFDECRLLAEAHVDMMFQLICEHGFGVKLDRVAQGLGIPGKTQGVSGADAPKLWAAGKCDDVLEYVSQDVRLTLQVALECERRREIPWVTVAGKHAVKPLPGGWLTVKEAMKLPLPDTSWMSTPWSRVECLAWMTPAMAQ